MKPGSQMFGFRHWKTVEYMFGIIEYPFTIMIILTDE